MSVALNLTMFGGATVLLLLTSGIIGSITSQIIRHFSICGWIPVIGLILTPMTFFGSPQDFKFVAYLAAGGTFVGTILLMVNISLDFNNNFSHAYYSAPTFKSFFLSFGKILFSFGGASAFPTFQNDMKHKEQFSRAVLYGFTGKNIMQSMQAVQLTQITVIINFLIDNFISLSITFVLRSNIITWLYCFWSRS